MSSPSQITTPDTTFRAENDSQIGDHPALPAPEKRSHQTLPSGAAGEEDMVYPEGLIFALIMASVLLSAFLVALDRTIIATAIPYITDEFDSLGDIGWYGSAYMLTNASVQLLFGRIYKFFSTKWVYLTAIFLFGLGSIICGVAPNSTALIVGRGIAGLGSAGMFNGGMLVLLYTLPLHRRPKYMGLFSSVFGIASISGPLIGGAFTDNATWRWCFYINLPIGCVAMASLALCLKVPTPKDASLPLKAKMNKLDPLGTIVFVPCIVCLILALQWGGTTYAWNDGRVIAPLVIFSVLLVVFVSIHFWKGGDGTVPPRIIGQRSISFGLFYSLCSAASMMIFTYYLPTWFQAIQGVDAVESGIRNIPFILSFVVASIISGVAIGKIGYYTPGMIVAPVLMSVGAGLITTFRPDTPEAQWIGYQIIYGLGIGCGMMGPNILAQTVLERADASVGIALMTFGQQLGGSIFVSIGQNLFASHLISGLSQIPGINPATIVDTGATDIRKIVPDKYLDSVLLAYNNALVKCFYVGVAMSCLMIVGALGVEWKSTKKTKGGPEGASKDSGEPFQGNQLKHLKKRRQMVR